MRFWTALRGCLTAADWTVRVTALLVMLLVVVAGMPLVTPRPAAAAEALRPSIPAGGDSVLRLRPKEDAGPPAPLPRTLSLAEIAEFDPREDLAYGAFQRGYYLTALALALKRAEAGDRASRTLIARIYDQGLGIARDAKEAAAWYELAAAEGDREAQFALAGKLRRGDGLPRDEARALTLMRQAAEGGHAIAQFNLAQSLMNDQPDPRRMIDALAWYRKAAEAGVAEAQYALAIAIAEGAGGRPNATLAREWMEKAATGGLDSAQITLGLWLARGEGGPVDLDAAHRWMARAARSGNALAQNRLARMYALGLGTEQDAVEGAKWYLLGRGKGLPDAWLDDFLQGLDEKTLAEARQRAARWPAG